MEYTYYYKSPLGRIMLASDGDALTGAWFEGQKYDALGLDSDRAERPLPVFDAAARWLDRYFAGEAPGQTPPLRMKATDFRRAVWEALLTIPYGETVTYGQLARRLAGQFGRGVSARAVGGAVGHNPISLFIPCHRVVGADGSLTGYAGGLERKRFLLSLEKTASERR